MKLTSGILMLGMFAGTAASAQNPNIIDNTRSKLSAVQQKKTQDSNSALTGVQGPAPSPSAKPAPHAVSSAVPQVKNVASKVAPVASKATPVAAKPTAATVSKTVKSKTSAKAAVLNKLKTAAETNPVVADKANPDAKKDSQKPISITGQRDPFISPVVNRAAGGSGCSTGKRCLAIDQIALRGVVKADAGMIAVVVNGINKAYFLRENDPVFNGYVVRITGDSIIFKETLQDKLGKTFVREVTKKITTPAV
jgi:hypothetical protein